MKIIRKFATAIMFIGAIISSMFMGGKMAKYYYIAFKIKMNEIFDDVS